MLMVVFGAGASYDSYPSAPPHESGTLYTSARPPLAAQLFSDREGFAKAAQDFPDCLAILPFLRHPENSNTVEQILEGFQSETGYYPQRAKQLTAVRYYLQKIIAECEDEWKKIHKGVTNFRTLLDEIEAWRQSCVNDEDVCLVTFNYDRMVESVVRTVGVNEIVSLSDYISQKYKLIKLHGSVDWIRAVTGVSFDTREANPHRLIQAAPAFQLTTDFQIATSDRTKLDHAYPFIPALTIPIVKKDKYECPPEHVQTLEKCLPQVTKLLTIGWRGSENNFVQLLAKHIKQPITAMIVSGSPRDAEETIRNLTPARLQIFNRYQRAEQGFSRFIRERSIVGFLQS